MDRLQIAFPDMKEIYLKKMTEIAINAVLTRNLIDNIYAILCSINCETLNDLFLV